MILLICLTRLFLFPGVLHGEEGENLQWRVSIDGETTEDGAVSQRTIGTLGDHRIVWWSRGTLVYRREEVAPAGMVQREYRIHNPVTDMHHRVGAAVGPLTFGPLRMRGSYTRFCDPTTGGVDPLSIGQTTGASLDISRDPTKREGVFLDIPGRSGSTVGGVHGPVKPFAVGGGYLSVPSRSSRRLPVRVTMSRIECAPRAGRFGGVIVTGGSVDRFPPAGEGGGSGSSTGYRDFMTESWLFPSPPARVARLENLGLTYIVHRGIRDEAWPFPPVRLFLEGWRQTSSYRPPRHAVSAAATVGSPSLRISARTVYAEAGYLDIDFTPVLRHRYWGVRVERESLLPAEAGSRSPRLFVSWESDRRSGWIDGVPDRPEDHHRGAIRYASTRWVRGCALEGEWPEERYVASVSLAVPREAPLPVEPAVTYAFNIHRSDRYRRHTGTITLSSPAFAATRRWTLSTRIDYEEDLTPSAPPQWHGAVGADISVHDDVTVSLRGEIEDMTGDESAWSVLLRLSWSRSGTIVGSPPDIGTEATAEE